LCAKGVLKQFGGFGLGLAISKAVVDPHRGTITVRSEGENLGAGFSVSLRLTGEPAISGNPIENRILHAFTTCVLVENHEDTAEYMQLFLEQLSYNVRTAGDLATALREIPKWGCDVLISDIGLPDGDGWELMERLGKQRPQFAIAMSGYGACNDQQRSRDAGYDHHLVKPFAPEAIGDLARSWQAERETVVTTRHEEVCPILQELSFPAVRVNVANAEVIEFDGLFSSLVNAAAQLITGFDLWKMSLATSPARTKLVGRLLSPIKPRCKSMWHSDRFMDKP
jgi:CheY-like chemotaxis protein